ncbi:hypothetical protein TCAL_06850 [Tigriopus californicus]|uniref:Fibrinogen C-terminal domain-containing protein n=2 Tax=Tigriopus californicus TaxID=6832 RepID=A0A553NDJ7_TIGCA|nr:hypothetical protein TCAL_06850 [Tigriopus californicus]
MVLNHSKSFPAALEPSQALPDQTDDDQCQKIDRQQTRKSIQTRVPSWSSSAVIRALICVIIFNFSVTCSNASYNQYKHHFSQPDQATVKHVVNQGSDPPNFGDKIKRAVRDVLEYDFNLTRSERDADAQLFSPYVEQDHHHHHDHHDSDHLHDNNLHDLHDPLDTHHHDHHDHHEHHEYGHHDHGHQAHLHDFILHEKTGKRTRRTYDFTRSYQVGTSCHDIQATQGASHSGVYLIHPPNLAQGPWRVFCDLETEGGGWMVFQVRDDVEPRENFMRGWEDYKVGFGDFDREFWLGNILIWAMTNSDNYTSYELAIDLEDWSGNQRFARYRSFRLGDEADSFRMYHQNLFYGNAGDSLFSHNGLAFSTFDVDNDQRDGEFSERSCARLYKGGWWYGNCHDSNLNGWALDGPHRSFADGINWYTWTGYNYSLRKTVMKLRPQIHKPLDTGFGNYAHSSSPQKVGRNSNDLKFSAPSLPKAPANKVEVPELLSMSNTLTNPTNFKTKHTKKKHREEL